MEGREKKGGSGGSRKKASSSPRDAVAGPPTAASICSAISMDIARCCSLNTASASASQCFILAGIRLWDLWGSIHFISESMVVG
ncbi:unnamed protein product [Urochloa humidicola]